MYIELFNDAHKEEIERQVTTGYQCTQRNVESRLNSRWVES